MNIANLKINLEKCIGCGLCIKVCPGSLLLLNENSQVVSKPITEFGWNGCWKCQHCLAVCPTGAISVLGKQPENSLPKLNEKVTGKVFDSLLVNRRSCRRFVHKNVEKKLIKQLLSMLSSVPNGGNKMQVEYTIVDDINSMDYLRKKAYKRMDEFAEQGIFAEGFDEKSYYDLKKAEKNVRPDMLFCDAPHLFIAHVPTGNGCWKEDAAIASAYFDLLCQAHGLGSIIMSYCIDVLALMPDILSYLQIPENHYFSIAVGFGYSEIKYVRGVQKEGEYKVNYVNIEDQ